MTAQLSFYFDYDSFRVFSQFIKWLKRVINMWKSFWVMLMLKLLVDHAKMQRKAKNPHEYTNHKGTNCWLKLNKNMMKWILKKRVIFSSAILFCCCLNVTRDHKYWSENYKNSLKWECETFMNQDNRSNLHNLLDESIKVQKCI